jgi:hypothetical protein
MKLFRWKNCYADVAAWKHGVTVQSFFGGVIAHTAGAPEEKIVALGRSDNPSDAFSLKARLERDRAKRSWPPKAVPACGV